MELLKPETQACILQVLGLASLFLPVAQKVADKTKNKIDNKVVGFVSKALPMIPRIRFGSK